MISKKLVFLLAFASSSLMSMELTYNLGKLRNGGKSKEISLSVPVTTSKVGGVDVNWNGLVAYEEVNQKTEATTVLVQDQSFGVQVGNYIIEAQSHIEYNFPTTIHASSKYIKIGLEGTTYIFNRRDIEGMIQAVYGARQSSSKTYSMIVNDKVEKYDPSRGLALGLGLKFTPGNKGDDNAPVIKVVVSKNVTTGDVNISLGAGIRN